MAIDGRWSSATRGLIVDVTAGCSMEPRLAVKQDEPIPVLTTGCSSGKFMPQASGGLEFTEYLRSHWLVIAGSITVALVLAGTGSFLLPERYTATTSVVIEPPAGNDPRGATAVSTVYLESLKTYELFASSDTLFSRALD